MAQANTTGLTPGDSDKFDPSPDLIRLLGKLNKAQARAVILIARAELTGQSVESLFEGKGKICARTTYYRKRPRGWVHKAEFQAALDQARREIRKYHLSDAVNDALEELKLATPLAARDLRRQIAGDDSAIDALADIASDKMRKADERQTAIRSLAAIGTPRATGALLPLLHDARPEVRTEAIEAMAVAAAGVHGPRRLADVAVLDRASKDTASKGVTPLDEFADMNEDELDQLIANLKTALGPGADVQAAAPGQA